MISANLQSRTTRFTPIAVRTSWLSICGSDYNYAAQLEKHSNTATPAGDNMGF